jgi:K+-transporting ATPase KdpF subunit
MSVITLIAAACAVLLVAYLFVALLRPEWF